SHLPPTEHAPGVGVSEAAGTLRPSSRGSRGDAAEVRERAVADDGRRGAGGADPRDQSGGGGGHGDGGGGGGGGAYRLREKTSMSGPNQDSTVVPESYIVSEGKKHGATRDVRPEAVHDRFYTVLRVHPGDAILTDNWHTN